MKRMIALSATLLFLGNLYGMEIPTKFDRLGLSKEKLQDLKRKSPQFAALLESLKKVKYDSRSDEFYSVPSIPFDIASRWYWTELQKLDSFPWGNACEYAVRKHDEPAAIIERYAKTLVAKAYAKHEEDVPFSREIVKQELLTAQIEINSDSKELSYIFTGRDIRVTPALYERWQRYWWADIRILLENNIPIAIAY